MTNCDVTMEKYKKNGTNLWEFASQLGITHKSIH